MKIKFIVNPKSKKGNNTHLWKVLRERFAHFFVDIEQTAYPRHALDIARQAVKENFDIVVAVGGDGTINEVLNGMVGTETALGIIPTGTANDLASYYHIPKDIIKASDLIVARHLQPVDVIGVNGWYYVTAGGIGLPSEVAGIANAIKSKGKSGRVIGQISGSKLYILVMIYALLKKKAYRNPLSICLNDRSLKTNALSLMMDNQPFLGWEFFNVAGSGQ